LKKYIFFISIFALLFSACSTKEVYEPKLVGEDWDKSEPLGENIIDTTIDIAELENKKVLTNNGILDIKVQEGKRVISESDGWIITAAIDGNLTLNAIVDTQIQENFELKKTIASASVKGNLLAVLFADNEMALYDIPSKSILFREQGGKSIAVNAKIVKPYFMNDLILYSTLDGKIVIVNAKMKKRLRTVIVSSEDNFNNIIYLNVVDNKIVAATGYKILALSQKEVRAKYEIRNITYDGTDLFITTKQGEVISLTPTLQVNAKIKFPFAHFLGMISDGENLYILEKEGYMIVLNKNMKDFTVHEVDFSDGFIFVADKVFYVADKKIFVK
jgi:hypothetical protein